MKNTMRKIACGAFAALTLTTCGMPAMAKTKMPHNPIAVVSTKEFDANWKKLDKNTIWCEKCIGKVDNKRGDGHNLANPAYYINYGADRYKGKKLPKGAKVTSDFFYGKNHEDVYMRVDYYKGTIVLFD